MTALSRPRLLRSGGPALTELRLLGFDAPREWIDQQVIVWPDLSVDLAAAMTASPPRAVSVTAAGTSLMISGTVHSLVGFAKELVGAGLESPGALLREVRKPLLRTVLCDADRES